MSRSNDIAGLTTSILDGVTATEVGLGNVDNTSDANKPVSTAQQTALDAKASLSGATFTGNVSFSDNNITNVGDISLDTISSDAGTSIGVTLGTDSGDDFNVGSGKLVVEGDGNIGIKTTAPDNDLEIGAYSGNKTLCLTSSTNGTTYIRMNDGDSSEGMFIRTDGASSIAGTKMKFGRRWGSDANLVTIQGDGYVGIGEEDPNAKLDVYTNHSQGWACRFHNAGNDTDRYGLRVQCGHNGTSGTTLFMHAYTNDGNITGYLRENSTGVFQVDDTSDEKLKENIVDSKIKGIEVINQIKVRDFDWKHNGSHQVGGLIAQELQPLIPFAVTEHIENGEPILCIARDSIITTLIKACQDLSAKVTALENA